MALNSVNTNMSAMVALQSLQYTNSQLQTVQRRVSTGYRVADAVDDGAAYAVAQSIRSTVGALTSANQQLGGVQGLLQTTKSGLNNMSNTMASMRQVLVKLSDTTTNQTDRDNYAAQYDSLMENVRTFISDATYNGKSLIGNLNSAVITDIGVARNEVGTNYNIASYSGQALVTAISFTSTQLQDATSVAGFISATGVFITQFDTVSTELNTIGSNVNYVNNQVSYNSDKIDALSSGLGSLVDADLAKESAQLQALQIRQQLGTQSLALANQSPAALLSLFK